MKPLHEEGKRVTGEQRRGDGSLRRPGIETPGWPLRAGSAVPGPCHPAQASGSQRAAMRDKQAGGVSGGWTDCSGP